MACLTKGFVLSPSRGKLGEGRAWSASAKRRGGVAIAMAMMMVVAMALALGLLASAGSPAFGEPASGESPRVLRPDRRFDVIPPPVDPENLAPSLGFAGRRLADWSIQLAGVQFDGPRLEALAQAPGPDPLEVRVREGFGRPVDLQDFIFFLDDLLRDGPLGLRDAEVWVTPSRARRAGILLHPDDIFKGRPRRYGDHGSIPLDPPQPQVDLAPARDGDLLGSAWAMRYRNPSQEEQALSALAGIRVGASFASRIRGLIDQLRAQGAQVYLNSTVRSRERGYLMWGAFVLSQAADEEDLLAGIEVLERARGEWELAVPIQWQHPGGWQATREAARAMAETYEVVYATEAGARASDHYTGRAVDLVVLALPRQLALLAPNGEIGRFDLSPPRAARDLSLSPEVIEWLEENFDLTKLRSDYPHWSDAE